jgi:hypothetical protein
MKAFFFYLVACCLCVAVTNYFTAHDFQRIGYIKGCKDMINVTVKILNNAGISARAVNPEKTCEEKAKENFK